MKKLVSYLLQGLLYTAPLAVTIYILYLIFTFADGLLKEILDTYFGINIPGLGLLIIIVLLILTGFLGQSFLGRPFKYLFARILKKAPMVKVIYSAFNDLFSVFVGKEKKFNRPVIVQVNMTSNLQKLGFLTEEDLSLIDEKDKVAVYFPHSYNFSGELFIVPANQVKAIDVPSSEVMKFIVSAGVADWD